MYQRGVFMYLKVCPRITTHEKNCVTKEGFVCVVVCLQKSTLEQSGPKAES